MVKVYDTKRFTPYSPFTFTANLHALRCTGFRRMLIHILKRSVLYQE